MSAKYQVVIKDFADTTTFGPGSPITILSDATNIGWSEYLNEVSEAFFTLSQEDPQISLINTALTLGKHVHIYRDGTLVWGGWLGESDETLNDVVFTAYSYVSGFYTCLMEWTREWTGINAHTIISDTFDYAKALTKSRVGWLTKGTVESLYITNGAGTLALPYYKAPLKRALSVFREISAYAISDTTNKVKFEVTPDGTFNLFRNAGSSLTDARWTMGAGKIRSYRRLRIPVDTRNEIIAVGSSPTDVLLQKTINTITAQTTNKNAAGLKSEPLYFSWVRDDTELDRVARIRANRALRVDTDFYASFFKDTLIPCRATGQDYAIGDTIDPSITRGATILAPGVTDRKIIVGQQVIFSQGAEYVRLLLADALG